MPCGVSWRRLVPNRQASGSRLLPLGRILVALGLFDMESIPFIPAERIDHSAPIVEMPEQGAKAEYGQYLMSITLCSMCHGPDLRGGPALEPESPPGPNITGYGAPGGWSEEQFVSTIRTGVTPYGKTLDPAFMPWDVFAKITDEELGAMWRFLASLSTE